MEKPLLIVITGCTGTGKTQLSLDLATRFNAEIINADAMQMYKGLDIATNKATAENRAQIRHHLMDFIEDDSPKAGQVNELDVREYCELAYDVVLDIQSRGKVPILIGGTMYYIQSLLFPDAVGSHGYATAESMNLQEMIDNGPLQPEPICAIAKMLVAAEQHRLNTDTDWGKKPSTEELFELLKSLDEQGAASVHPNDRRKVKRALSIYVARHWLRDVASNQNQTRTPLHELFKIACLITWMPLNLLDSLLDFRVHEMIEKGLVEELAAMRQLAGHNAQSPPDTTRGRWQTIGYKEFTEYFNALALEDHDKDDLLEKAIEKVQMATRRYARTQLQWLRKKLWRSAVKQGAHVAAIQVSSHEWQSRVLPSTIQWINDILQNREPDMTPFTSFECIFGSPLTLESSQSDVTEHPKFTRIHCDLCHKDLYGEHAAKKHFLSQSHRRCQRSQKKKLLQMEQRRLKVETL